MTAEDSGDDSDGEGEEGEGRDCAYACIVPSNFQSVAFVVARFSYEVSTSTTHVHTQ